MKLKAGHTIESIMETVRAKNNGTKSQIYCSGFRTKLCAYRGENNNACLIGCFIPDNEYNDNLEMVIDQLLKMHPKLNQYMPFEFTDDLYKFQKFHDKYTGDNLHADLEKFLVENVE